MNIAVIENEILHSDYLQILLTQWSKEHLHVLDLQVFPSGEDFLAIDCHPFDLVFMDIQMGGLDGLATAHHLREHGFQGELVFLTAFSEYVFAGYEVHALNYLLKPISYPQIAKCMDHVSRKLHDDHYTYRNHSSLVQIPYSQIICFTSSNHHTQVTTTEGSFLQLESMQNIFSYLPSRFMFCHRTVIVNLDHITMLKGRELLLSNHQTVPVSHRNLPNIRSALLAYADSMR